MSKRNTVEEKKTQVLKINGQIYIFFNEQKKICLIFHESVGVNK